MLMLVAKNSRPHSSQRTLLGSIISTQQLLLPAAAACKPKKMTVTDQTVTLIFPAGVLVARGPLSSLVLVIKFRIFSMSENQQVLQKSHQAISGTNPLREGAILQHALGYVGPGHFLFAALVSKAWHQACLQVPDHDMTGASLFSVDFVIVCVPQMTLYSAAVASLTMFHLAQHAGVVVASSQLQVAAGRWGSKATILAVAAAGPETAFWTFVTIGALHSCHLSTLQWLVEELDHPLPDRATQFAARGGCVDIIAWL
jgi:hypothetical protein